MPFSNTFKYIGFIWSLSDKIVTLPNDKWEKYLLKLKEWSQLSSVSLRTTKSLIGTLNHICLVIPQGHSHLPALYAFWASFSINASRFLKHQPHKAVTDEIEWWKATLSKEWCSIKIKQPPKPTTDNFFVDASTSWGIGLVINDEWLAWPLKVG